MKATVLPRYLLGERAAILEVAASRVALPCALLFVLSAGFAREYDGEDLLHQPWHALRPLGASFVAGTVLFGLVHGIAMLRRKASAIEPPSFVTAYRTFLTLFWMMAPMAWLYAVPYERLVSPVTALEVNLWTLAIVSVWRVALVTRVISVVYGMDTTRTFFIVMLFADVLVFVLVSVARVPVFDIMGGLRHSDRDALIAGAAFMTTCLGVLSAPVWFFGVLAGIARIRPSWAGFARSPVVGGRGLLVVAIISVVAWLPVLLVVQPEQINRYRAERLLRAGAVDEAFTMMSAKQSGDYPPHWNPPPRVGYGERVPDLGIVRDAMWAQPPAEWVALLYVAKQRRGLRKDLVPYSSHSPWSEVIDSVELGYGRTPEQAHADAAAFLLEFDTSLPPKDRDALQRLIAFIESPPTESPAESDNEPVASDP